MTSKKIWLMMGAAISFIVLCAVLLFLSTRSEKTVPNRPEVEALGMRGTSKVSRLLSKTQVGRLEQHFLDVPPPAPMKQSGGP